MNVRVIMAGTMEELNERIQIAIEEEKQSDYEFVDVDIREIVKNKKKIDPTYSTTATPGERVTMITFSYVFMAVLYFNREEL